MNILLYVLAGILVNTIVGATVLSSIDDEDSTLFKWYCACPDPTGTLQFLTLNVWPLLWYLRWKDNRNEP